MLTREENNLNRYYHALFDEGHVPSASDYAPYGDLSDIAAEMFAARAKDGLAGLKKYLIALGRIKDPRYKRLVTILSSGSIEQKDVALNEPEQVGILLTEVKPRSVSWLWYPRLAFGKMSMLDPLFLSQRRKPYGYEAFKPHWKKLCQRVGITLNIHAMRHWYTTMAMRMIMEEAQSSAEIVLRKEELVRYMAWRNPETIKTYENYFKSIGHYNVQDKIHESLEKEMKDYVNRQRNDEKRLDGMRSQTYSSDAQKAAGGSKKESLPSSGWEKLLALGGV